MSSRNKRPYLVLSAPIGAALYCIFTYVAVMFYPYPFGPLTDYLSVLGNSALNPQGAVYYSLAVAFAGMSLFPFYVGIYSSNRESNWSRVLALVVLIGMFNGLSIIMTGVFSEDTYDLHFFWSFMIFLSWVPVLLITNGVLVWTSGLVRAVSAFGLLLGVFDFVFVVYVVMFGTGGGAIMEWITIFAFLGWAVALSGGLLRRSPSQT